jgi:hypothetical protein
MNPGFLSDPGHLPGFIPDLIRNGSEELGALRRKPTFDILKLSKTPSKIS